MVAFISWALFSSDRWFFVKYQALSHKEIVWFIFSIFNPAGHPKHCWQFKQNPPVQFSKYFLYSFLKILMIYRHFFRRVIAFHYFVTKAKIERYFVVFL